MVSDGNLKTGGFGGGQKQRSASTVDAYLAIERIAGKPTHHPIAIAVMVLLSQGTLAVKHVVSVHLLLIKEKGKKGERGRKGGKRPGIRILQKLFLCHRMK